MPTSDTPHPQKDPEATRKLLADLWERSLPVVRDRCAQLEATLVAIRTHTLTSQQREEAIANAHKLAGSLGMFGYPEATDHARRIEQQLEAETPTDVATLSKDIAALQAALPL